MIIFIYIFILSEYILKYIVSYLYFIYIKQKKLNGGNLENQEVEVTYNLWANETVKSLKVLTQFNQEDLQF